MISVNRIIRGVMIGSLLLAVALMATACGGAERFYIDEAGRGWRVVDSVTTTAGEVPLLTKATHADHCAIKATVEAIAPVSAAHQEIRSRRYDPKYFFVYGADDAIPTMCYSGHGCVEKWGDIPAWMTIYYEIDGLYYYRGGQYELIMIRAYPDGYMNFARLLYVVVHEEVHGLGYDHGEEMDRVIDIIYSQALNNLAADPGCRDIPNWTWEKGRVAGDADEARRSVD